MDTTEKTLQSDQFFKIEEAKLRIRCFEATEGSGLTPTERKKYADDIFAWCLQLEPEKCEHIWTADGGFNSSGTSSTVCSKCRARP